MKAAKEFYTSQSSHNISKNMNFERGEILAQYT